MCGIFCYIGKKISCNILEKEFMKTQYRGPDRNVLQQISPTLTFGFHRLAINGISYKGDQPFYHPSKPYVLICNGEIYNSEELKERYNITTYSESDCEVILYLYERFGFEETLKMLDSESFAMCIYDGNRQQLFVARDRFGVRPLFYGRTKYGEYVFASEFKSICNIVDSKYSVQQFQPGHWKSFDLTQVDPNNGNLAGELTEDIAGDLEKVEGEYRPFYDKAYKTQINLNPVSESDVSESDALESDVLQNIKRLFTRAVKKRLMSDRPIGCLLSGGLDSSLVSALVARELKECGKQLQTFAIGITGSTDLFHAKAVAEHIGSIHHSIELTEQEFLDAIPEVIQTIESYDTTTVRASVGNYLVGKYIHENTDITVVFNGDGSDEQSGYKYLAQAPDAEAFHNECCRLLDEIHMFDVLRSDRSLSSRWSLETRTPFLDTDFVNYYMSVPVEMKMYPEKGNRIEKYLLRKAFDNDGLLPHNVLYRKKEAFSDGCSSTTNSWHKIIQRHVDSIVTDSEFQSKKDEYKHLTPSLKESYYYRKIFESYYGNADDKHMNDNQVSDGYSYIIPHFWLPKWNGNQNDPSAREL